MKKFLLPTLFILPGAAAFAEPITFDFKDPKGVNNVVFLADAPLETINGTADGISGTVTIDPADPSKIDGRIVVETKSMHVPNPVMKEHLHGENWLNAAKHPEIVFELDEVKNFKLDGNKATADVVGKFTLNGVTKDIVVPVTGTYLEGRLKDRSPGQEGDILVLRSEFKVNRSAHNIQPGQNLDKVADDIEIKMSIAGIAPKK